MRLRSARAGLLIVLAASRIASAAEPEVRYPYRVEGACPFECCDYGTWTARSDIPVFSAERTRIAPAFTIRNGEEFEAVTGATWALAPFIVKSKTAVEIPLATYLVSEAPDRAKLGHQWSTQETLSLPAGAQIHVVANLGEGALVGLAAGKPVALDASMYDAPGADYEIAKARPANATEWWIQVKSGDRSGWFERGKYAIDGSDRCE